MYDNYILNKSIHYVSNCGSDERGMYHGGQAGDQTGGEWVLKAYSKYWDGWNCVLRHPDHKVALMLAVLACAAALNNKIGYDQYQRDTYWTLLANCGYDPSKITIPCETDCSAGVIAHVRARAKLFGMPELSVVNATYTGDMRQAFKAAGFQIITDVKRLNSPDWLLPGDILLNDTYHTCTNVTAGKYVRSIWIDADTEVIIPEIKLAAKSQTRFTVTGSPVPSKKARFVGQCRYNDCNVRVWAGTGYKLLMSWPRLNKGNCVEVLDSLLAVNNDTWYYIRINNTALSAPVYGFIHSDLIEVKA